MNAVVVLAVGLVVLVAGAELLVRGATRLAAAIGVSPLIIGLTVVAYGTSAPELAVSSMAALGGRPDIALGNVIGSNIFNVLLILGIAALITPLRVSSQLVRTDVPLMIGASFALLVLGRDGMIGRLDGMLLVSSAILYTVLLIRKGRREIASERARNQHGEPARIEWPRPVALVLAGLVLLVLGAHWLVDGATSIARGIGVSELIIGLTIVAAGTSLPEAATSVLASFRGQRDLAVGNVVGSNLFNILAILGTASLLHPIRVASAAIHFDIPLMIAVAVACLPIFFTGGRVGRREGALLLAYYAAYVLYLFLSSTSHDALPAFSRVMAEFVAPITALSLALSAWNWHRRSAI